ncbi:hypothetical protein [Pseudomonas fragi]|uniref:hypothetical protein n=1 Tax=Pseudomonas fragi TaxID=296 RepID=UPI00031A0124|nr:hypothetical protein [Pseudomonas fragi]MDE4515139.1 hypothetical protein [Pseudomonas fragi]PAA05231.1 hypothetical protein CJU78_18020 [Pseudomonas fragi]QPC37553.1 hypothetical protein IS178_10395 [Pseudomonas fragi]SDU14972.1 hypothetical protein SAMN05216594_1070 [Pseudomonas fragi]
MPNPHLAPVEPSAYRWAVHCCSYKLDLSHKPDRAVALFEHESAAKHFGGLMWPSTFEVVDLQSPVGAGR